MQYRSSSSMRSIPRTWPSIRCRRLISAFLFSEYPYIRTTIPVGGIRDLARSALLLLAFAALASSCGADSRRPPGGKFLVYTRHLNANAQAVWIARLDGTHPRLLVRQGLFGAISPDGRWIAYDKCLAPRERCQTGNAPFALFLIPTSGGKARLLARSTTYPSWSPKSDRIVGLRRHLLVS